MVRIHVALFMVKYDVFSAIETTIWYDDHGGYRRSLVLKLGHNEVDEPCAKRCAPTLAELFQKKLIFESAEDMAAHVPGPPMDPKPHEPPKPHTLEAIDLIPIPEMRDTGDLVASSPFNMAVDIPMEDPSDEVKATSGR